MVHVQIFVLVFLTPHDAGQLMLAGHRVGAVLGKDHRAAVQGHAPTVHLSAEGSLGIHNVHAAHDIPAIVAVQADKVGKLLALAVVGQAHHYDGIGARTLLGVDLMCQIKQRLEVGFGSLARTLGLIQDAPRNDTGVVLVAVDHVDQRSLVVLQQLRGGLLLKPTDLLAVALTGGQEIHRAFHKANGGNLVDDKEALLIGHLVQLLSVGIVAGAEAVGTDPLHQLIIALDGGQIQTAAADVGVLMLAEAAQIDGLAVQKEVAVLDLKGADADLLMVFVHNGLAIGDANNKAVQVGSVDIPQPDILDMQRAALAIGMCDLFCTVIHIHADGMVTVRCNGVGNIGVGAAEAVYYAEVQYALLGQRHQLDRAVDAGIVVKVKVRHGHFFAVGQGGRASGGQHGLIQLIVCQNGQMVMLVIAHDVGDGSVKGQEAALMRCDLDTVYKDAGMVGHRAEANGNVLALPLAGNKEVGLVPEIAAILAGVLIGKEIAERCRHRHGDALGQGHRPALVHTLTLRIEGETPHAVKADYTAGAGFTGVQQRFVLHGIFSS